MANNMITIGINLTIGPKPNTTRSPAHLNCFIFGELFYYSTIF